MKATNLLQHATSVIEDRQGQYGDPGPLFELIARRWSLTLDQPVTPSQVAVCLIDLKLARLAANPGHLDSIVDVAGYAALLGELRP